MRHSITRHIALICALMCAAAAPVYAADPYADIIDAVLTNNADLASQAAAMRAEYQAAKADNALPATEVEFERSYAHKGAPGSDRWALSVSQGFEWPGAYKARNAAAEAHADALSAMQRSRVLDKALEARMLLLEWSYAQRRLTLLQSIAANIDSLSAATTRSFDMGEASILDVKKLKLQSLLLSNDIAGATADIDAARAALIALNGGKTLDLDAAGIIAATADDTPQPLAAEDAYLDAFYLHDPMLQSQAAALTAAQQRLSAAKASSLPGLSLGYVHNYEDGTHFNGFSMGLTLPLWGGNRRRAAATAAIESISAGASSYEMSTRADIISTYARARSLQRRLHSYAQVLGDAEYQRLLRVALAGGQISVMQYINEVNYLIDNSCTYLSLRHDYEMSLARLNRFSLEAAR